MAQVIGMPGAPQPKLVSLGAGLAVLLSMVACQAKAPTRIADITASPAAYEAKQVVLSGEYRGWEAGHGSPPVTRSDWILKDATGAIYVTGRVPSGFEPAKDAGRKVTVSGVVRVKDNRAYVEAETVE